MSSIGRRTVTSVNWTLFALTLILFTFGVLNLYSASGYRLEDGISINPFYQKQLVWGLLGLGGMVLVQFFDYRHLQSVAWPLYLLSLVLLIAVFVTGRHIYGARRWLDLGFFNFQPSEMAKIAVLIVGASILSREKGRLKLVRLGYVAGVGLLPAGLIILQPDLGSALSLLLMLGGMIFYRGLTKGVFRALLVAVPCLLPLSWFVLHDYQKLRILSFLNPEMDPMGAGYHKLQSEIAVGSGRIWGKGFLEGTQSQLRFLPEKHTDFAFAVFGEEWGFVGAMVLLALLCVFLFQMMRSAREARDLFGSYLAAGIFFYFFWQILINMGMVLGLMPVVGIPLPFLSYGGTATLVNFCLVGLVLNISMRRFSFKQR